MLEELHVRELALVERARVRFSPGLNLLTGETGSGKSLIVDALGLALGGRASSEQVRQGADRALVEARFEISDVPAAAETMAEMGLERSSDLVLTREVARRGAARVNGRPAAPAQLRDLGRLLVGVHSQHEHHLLLDPETQTQLLDSFAGAASARQQVADYYLDWSQAASRLAELERIQARGQREEEYLRWQLEELRQAQLRPGEDEELAAERGVARHASRLVELVEGAVAAIRSEDGLSAASGSVQAAAELDARLEPAAHRLRAAEAEVSDAAAELRHYREAIDLDPARLEAIESRLAVLEQVKRKYGGSLQAAIDERDRLASQLEQASDLGTAIQAAAAALEQARTLLEAGTAELSECRRQGAQRLGRVVKKELAGLSLADAAFEVRLLPRTQLSAEGAEEAEMVFSANPGEAAAPLVKVASGGELARVMLAIRTAGAEADRLPTLVFDEVDAGIGGEAAVQVGFRLKRLGAVRQVLVVTHLAQVACFADHHLVVEKGSGGQGRNVVQVRELQSQDERAGELARMMSGRVTEKALARAHELLDEGRRQ
ncbi:MAG: DNA repair protein RecN [Candidatus Dormibacteraeota bacterium]|nr:DNA repair protein RecN [Candidatus Dormibacteraeota bacterium]